MRSALAIGCIAGLVWVGCGGEEEAGNQVFAERGGIELSAASAKDQRIASDLAEYLRRGCNEPRLTAAEFRREIFSGEAELTGPQLEAFFRGRYGGLAAFLALGETVCRSYDRIEVSAGRITIHTSLGSGRLDRVAGDDICDLIGGADVADFTPGHRVLADDGETLAEC